MKNIKAIKKWVLSKIFRPLRILTIICRCPLRDDCKEVIRIQILTYHNDYKPEEIFDYIIKSIGRHLANSHKVKFFQGIEYKTEDMRYTLMGNYIHRQRDNWE